MKYSTLRMANIYSDSFNLLPLIVKIMLESMTFNFTRCTKKKKKERLDNL